MKILQVIPELDAGGAERTTVDVAEAVINAGGEAYVVSQGGRLETELKALGAHLISLPVKSKNPFVIWQNAGRLADLIKAHKIDAIHARSRAPAWSCYWAAKRTGIPYITTYHGTYNAKTGLKRWYNSVMAKGDHVIANSHFIADHIRAEHGISEDRLSVIPRGVDLEKLRPEAVSAERLDTMRQSWDVEPSTPLILLPARLTAWKGQEVAIRALAQIDNTDAVLVLAGDAQGRDQYVQGLKDLAQKLGVYERIRIPGHILDMPAAYLCAQIVLTPSIEPEAFGRTAAEAQAMGVAVIAADHGGAREVIEDQITGWRVTPNDPDALGKAINKVMALSQNDREKLAQAAKARIVQYFSKHSLQNKTLRVYHEALE